jgi:hypothetical protein
MLRMVRFFTATAAMLVLMFAFMPWIAFEDTGATLYGPQVKVVFGLGDGFVVALLGFAILVSRIVPVVWPRLWAVFPAACMIGGLSVMSVSASVIFKDWSGERRWPLFGELVLGILLAAGGALLATLWASARASRGAGAAGGAG